MSAMIGEYLSVPTSGSSGVYTDFLIADEDGSVRGIVQLETPGEELHEAPSLVLPKDSDRVFIGGENEGLTLPNMLGTIIRNTSGEIRIVGGFSANIDTSASLGMVVAHAVHNREVLASKEAEEKAREKEYRQKDAEELRDNPEAFLVYKGYHRLIALKNEGLVSPEIDANEENYLSILSVIEDPYIQTVKGETNLYEVLSDLIRKDRRLERRSNYMTKIDKPVFNLLASQLTASLDKTEPKERRAIYDVVGQLDIPLESQETLLWRMEEYNDYQGNPLAARYALNQYIHNEDGPWVRAQTERQKILEQHVQCSPEEAMGNFDESMRLAHRIVFSSPPGADHEGMVGMEFEGKAVCGEAFLTDISNEWSIGDDYRCTEVRKNFDRLSPSMYYAALVEFDEWAQENFVSDPRDIYAPHLSRTTHIHLDRKLHPTSPLYGLYDNLLEKNSLGTWEIRGIMPFKSAAESLAFMKLAIHSASSDSVSHSLSDALPVEGVSSWQQLLYGHIVHSTEDPQARVAALVALRDPYAMRAFDIEPLVDTYGKEVLQLLYEQTDNFLGASSVGQYIELYEASAECQMPRESQKLHDSIITPTVDVHTALHAVEVMSSDPAACLHLLDILLLGQDQVGISSTRLHATKGRILSNLSAIDLDTAVYLLPKILSERILWSRYHFLDKLAHHEKIADMLVAELNNPGASAELLESIVSAIEKGVGFTDERLELVMDVLASESLPRDLEECIARKLFYYGYSQKNS